MFKTIKTTPIQFILVNTLQVYKYTFFLEKFGFKC